MTEQNNTERELPEMQPGSTGMYMISAEDGIKMGPSVLQAFMQKLRAAADLADLEVKVEPMRGALMIWWYAKTEPTFLDDLAQHMGVVVAGEMDVVLEEIGMTLEELTEGLKALSGTKQNVINLKPNIMTGEKATAHIAWVPKAGWDSKAEPWNWDASNEHPPSEFYSEVEGGYDLDSNTPVMEYVIYWEKLETWIEEMFHTNKNTLTVPRTNLIPYSEGEEKLKELFQKACSKLALKGTMELHSATDYLTFSWSILTPEDVRNTRTYLDAVFDDIGKTERGTTRANKARMLQAADVETMTDLLKYFETLGSVQYKELRVTHSGLNAEAVISWRPYGEKGLAWPLEDGE